jgi:hypothetical protein
MACARGGLGLGGAHRRHGQAAAGAVPNPYLPIDTPSMQERVRGVEFLLSRLGLQQQVIEHAPPQRNIVTLVKRS